MTARLGRVKPGRPVKVVLARDGWAVVAYAGTEQRMQSTVVSTIAIQIKPCSTVVSTIYIRYQRSGPPTLIGWMGGAGALVVWA